MVRPLHEFSNLIPQNQTINIHRIKSEQLNSLSTKLFAIHLLLKNKGFCAIRTDELVNALFVLNTFHGWMPIHLLNPFGSNLNPSWGRSPVFSLLVSLANYEQFFCNIVSFGGSVVGFRGAGFGSSYTKSGRVTQTEPLLSLVWTY